MSDNDHWGPDWIKIVRGVYATIVGTGVIVGGLQTVPHLLEDGELSIVESLFAGGLVAVGIIAAFPWIFMPVLSMILKFLGKKTGDE